MVQDVSVVFVVVIIGYVLLSRSNLYRHRLLTDSKYTVLYESAFAGGSLFVLVFWTTLTIKTRAFNCTSIRVEGLGDFYCTIDRVLPFPFLDVLAATFLISMLIIGIGNLVLTDRKLGEQIARKSGVIANVVLDAQNDEQLVQITTTRGKVYVGWVLLGPGISRDGKVEDIAVAPLFSGHRDPNTQQMLLDIDYSLALDELADLAEKEDEEIDARIPRRAEMSVVIPMGEIALIRRHDEVLKRYFVPMRK